ncbi:MAG: 2-oxoglutarate dehydrogenase, E2 component, dihydrolipoamide succinyltransferase [Bacteroidota bacterium]|nr:2-oxoglutarate dehydrogenase, E2 component, dihydrolipoamide succinyltransferase [Bacteroidota bacterium]
MARVEVPMPKMGESITEGTVIVWHKQVGDRVELDETLLEIGTDKVDTEVPAVAAGTVAEILAQEGDVVPVGTVIAAIETEELTPPQPASVEAASSPAERQPASVEAASSPAEHQDVPVVMPKMGESITEGTVIAWHKKVGDAVELDETIAEIGTDKVDTELPSPAAGILKAILVGEGDTVEVGAPIALLSSKAGASQPSRPAAPHPSDPKPVPRSAEPSPQEVSRHLQDGRFLSPLVRSIAKAEGVGMQELSGIRGSGREGRITKQDLLDHMEAKTAPQAPAPARVQPARPTPMVKETSDRVDIVEMDRMRQLIAEHMTHSRRTAAHVTSFAEMDVTNLIRIRNSNKAKFHQQNGIKLTYTPFFVYAAVQALRDYPLLNSSVEGTRILIRKDFNVGVAVAIEKTGLIVPVIKHAGRHSIAGLAHEAHDLAKRARSMDLQPDDLQGGTFTLTNIGSLGSLMGTPIILQPQVAILATGTITKRPVVIEDPVQGDLIGIRNMMYLSLSYDHRIIDGAMGIAFLNRFIEVVQGLDPAMNV